MLGPRLKALRQSGASLGIISKSTESTIRSRRERERESRGRLKESPILGFRWIKSIASGLGGKNMEVIGRLDGSVVNGHHASVNLMNQRCPFTILILGSICAHICLSTPHLIPGHAGSAVYLS